MKTIDLDIWKYFYEVAIKVRDAKPWKQVFIDDLIAVKYKRKTYYCCIMGQAELNPSISIYCGKEGLSEVGAMLDGLDEGWNGTYVAGDQNCLVCYFGDREEVPQDQMEIIHALKPGFRGKGKWVFCKRAASRFYPVTPDNKEIEIMTHVFEGLLYGLEQLKNEQPDWKNNYFCVSYKSKTGSWEASTIQHLDCMFKYPSVVIDDKVLIREMKRQPVLNEVWFVDNNYLFVPMEDETGRLVNPLMFLFVNLATELIEDMKLIDPDETEETVVINSVIDKILANGIPEAIVTRCPRIYYALENICETMNIDLLVDSDNKLDYLLKDVMGGFLDFLEEDLSQKNDLLN